MSAVYFAWGLVVFVLIAVGVLASPAVDEWMSNV